LDDFGCDEVIEITDPGFKPFGGKYVHSPAIARIANGEKLTGIGNPFDIKRIRKINIDEGTIVHIDNFGLMKVKAEAPRPKDGDYFLVNIKNKKIKMIYWTRMMSRDNGEWVIYPGSSFGLLEIGRVRENGALDIGAEIGDKITFKKI